MTYVVGLALNGMNSILCDTRGTWSTPSGSNGENVLLKTGLLFPGCIFGRVGNFDNSRAFILAAKHSVTPTNTIAGFWSDFVNFASDYAYPDGPNNHFQILLSTRHSGEPRFHILDSSEGLSEVRDLPITLGSGKKILDDLVRGDFHDRISLVREAIKGQPFGNELYPYLFCQWLSELSLTFEHSLLERHKVGGPFHFIFQVSASEHTQKPSLYVFYDVDKPMRRIYWWQYRLSHIGNWLIIDKMIPPGQLSGYPSGKQERVALIDEASLPPKETGVWDYGELHSELEETIEEKLSAQELYFFCGFGFTDSRYRTPVRFHATTKGDYVITEDGIRDDFMQLLIDDVDQL